MPSNFDTDECVRCGAEIPVGDPLLSPVCDDCCDQDEIVYDFDDSAYRRAIIDAGRGHLLLR
jgi:hypothetical protein